MKQRRIILISIVLVSGLLLYACEFLQRESYCSDRVADELILNDTIELRYGELYCNSRYEIRLAVDSILDSRCPIGAMCFWEGNGQVKLSLSQAGNPSSFWLNTHVDFRRDTVVHGLKYELINLLPYPDISKEYELEDARVFLLITD